MMTWGTVVLGFIAGAGGSWLNSYLTEQAVKGRLSSKGLPSRGAGLFGLFFMTKLLLLFAFCYALIRFLGFSVWGIIAGMLTHQVFRLFYLAYRYRAEIGQSNEKSIP